VVEEWRRLGLTIPEYTEELIAGVQAEQEEIDAALAASSEGWTVPRMAIVDRTILRVACHELRAGLPAAIAINEAVEAANELSSEDSGRFINGLLGRIARGPDDEPVEGGEA
jgi:N utilization substance protein B